MLRLSACTYLKNAFILHKILTVAIVQSFCDNSAVCFVLVVLWMTSCFYIIRHIWRAFSKFRDCFSC